MIAGFWKGLWPCLRYSNCLAYRYLAIILSSDFFSSRFMEFHSTHADWYSSIDSRGSLCVFLELRLSVTPSSLVICFQLFQPPQLLHTPNSSCGKCTRGLELGLPAPGFRNCFRQKATVTEHLPLLFLSSNSPVLMVVQYLKTCFV